MAQSATLVSLPQMVDLSLNCPEGNINFQVLHTLLNVMLQKLSLDDVAIEFRGADSDRIQSLISTAKHNPMLFPEYAILGAKGKKQRTPAPAPSPKKQISLKDIVEPDQEQELQVIERRKNSRQDPDPNPPPLRSPPGSLADIKTVVVIEAQSQLPQYSVAISKTAFDKLQYDIDSLKERMKELLELPGNMGLLEAVKSQQGPILDMFQILNLVKRMDAAETSMEKLGSLIEDVAKVERGSLIDITRKSIGSTVVLPERLEERLADLERAVEGLGRMVESGDGAQSRAESVSQTVPQPEVRAPPREDTDRHSHLPTQAFQLFVPDKPFESSFANVDLSTLEPAEALALIQTEFQNLRSWVTSSLDNGSRVKKSVILPDIQQQTVDTAKFEEYAQLIEELRQEQAKAWNNFTSQFNNVQRDMNDIYTKLSVVLPGGDSSGINEETTIELSTKISLLEKDLIALADQAAKMEDEKLDRDKQIEAILEQLDVLKIVKANREDLEDALGEKADACMINRKVSHDQFDAACDDLSRGIEEALAKLEEQEEMWHQALNAIQKEIGNKLDKMEVDPLRDFVNSKLKALQEKFKSLTALKREHEAAGTKSKLLRDVNCISCDKDAVMRREMDPTLNPKPYAMPPTRSMAPYLAYELDQLRKQQKCVPGSKNLNFIENALKTRGGVTKDHVCNRYCGGSHTVTTPQQRVTRLGHFLEQWGPEIAPLQDEYIKGKDNHMYKADTLKKLSTVKEAKKSLRRSENQIPTTDTDEPQQDRSSVVNPLAQDLIEEEEAGKSTRRSHNIGSIGLSGTLRKGSTDSKNKEQDPSQVSSRKSSAEEQSRRATTEAQSRRATSTEERKSTAGTQSRRGTGGDQPEVVRKSTGGSQERKSTGEGQEVQRKSTGEGQRMSTAQRKSESSTRKQSERATIVEEPQKDVDEGEGPQAE